MHEVYVDAFIKLEKLLKLSLHEATLYLYFTAYANEITICVLIPSLWQIDYALTYRWKKRTKLYEARVPTSDV